MKKILGFVSVMVAALMALMLQAFAVSPSDAAAYVTDGIEFKGSSAVQGDAIVTGGKVESVKSLYHVTGTLYIADNVRVNNKGDFKIAQYTGETQPFAPVTADAFPGKDFFAGSAYSDGSRSLTIDWAGNSTDNYLLEENAYINRLVVKNNLTLKIDAPTGTIRVIRAKSAELNGNIVVEGGGQVILYADSVKFSNNSVINKGGAADKFLLIVENKCSLQFSELTGNIIALDEVMVNNIQMTGNLYVQDDVKFVSQGVINGLVYAPDGEVEMTGSSRVNGMVIAESLEMSGSAVISKGDVSLELPDIAGIIAGGQEDEDKPQDVSGVKVIEYDAVTGEYRRGRMQIKRHVPVSPYPCEYDVLDEDSFVETNDPLENKEKDMVRTIAEVTQSVFDFRKDEISLYPFGRVDLEAYQYSLTISPYVVPKLQELGIDATQHMWLVMGDRHGKVLKAWMVVD